MADRLITVIVPVYNTPLEYMDPFFESLKKLSCRDFDLIIANDGSSEECVKYLKEKEKEFDHCILICLEHRGVSATRNKALEIVKSDYVAFADADDEISPYFIEKGIEYIRQFDPDIIYSSITFVPDTKETKQSGTEVELFCGKEEIKTVKKKLLNIASESDDYCILGTPCGRLYRTEIVREAGFDEDVRYYEDQLFNRKAIDLSNRIVVVPDAWYFYIQHSDSSLHKAYNSGYYEKMMPFLNSSMILDKNEDEQIQMGMRQNYLHILYSIINYDLVCSKNGFTEDRNQLKKIAESEVFKDTISAYDFHTKGTRFIDVLNIKMFRMKLYGLVLLEKKLYYLMKRNKI